MKITPLDMRQQRFRTTFRGYERTEVVAFLTEAADDYESALREIDRLRQDYQRVDTQLSDYREREANLRNTLLTAQRLADELREQARQEARIIVRDAEARADLLMRQAQARADEFDREIGELRLRRRDTEGSIEAVIRTLQHALEFVRSQERQERPEREEKILLHRPRQPEIASQPLEPSPGAVDRKAQG